MYSKEYSEREKEVQYFAKLKKEGKCIACLGFEKCSVYVGCCCTNNEPYWSFKCPVCKGTGKY